MCFTHVNEGRESTHSVEASTASEGGSDQALSSSQFAQIMCTNGGTLSPHFRFDTYVCASVAKTSVQIRTPVFVSLIRLFIFNHSHLVWMCAFKTFITRKTTLNFISPFHK